jgi:2'-hydroxyisoflavone reductase
MPPADENNRLSPGRQINFLKGDLPMKLLVLGGTLFLGRHVVEHALERGHAVTLFTRGRTNPALFPDAEKLVGDRAGDLGALRARTWDAVIDTCGYVPRIAHASAAMLKDAVEHYTFISSISVYAEMNAPGIKETAPVGVLETPTEEIGPDTYGPLKALCESAVEAAMPGRTLNVRPGLLVGPFDPSGRFTYWVRRVAAGGEVLAPGEPKAQVQIIDARDAAAWLVRCAEARVTGVFNMTGPETRLSMDALLEVCRQTLTSDARFTWVPEAFLLERNVTPWTELPLWLPADDGGVMSVDIRRALATGLAFRPLPDTIRDTFVWQEQLGPEPAPAISISASPKPKVGLAAERETELLTAWHALPA